MSTDAPTLHVKLLRAGAVAPQAMSDGAAGMDLVATLDAPVELMPGARAAIGTGLALAIPPGFEGQVRPRSGLAREHGVTVLNAPGTIDADYRGEVMVLLVNHGSVPVTISSGQRIAQLVVAAVARPEVALADELPATARGAGGFGSTGR
ncbi:MAG: dUTP diphosphatase [Kofleriaceae bacterium]